MQRTNALYEMVVGSIVIAPENKSEPWRIVTLVVVALVAIFTMTLTYFSL